jgi:hypothetical protein
MQTAARWISVTILVGIAGIVLYPAPVTARRALQGPPPGPSDGWSGSIRVARSGSTTQTLDGGAVVTSSATQNISYTVRSDGSASFVASHNETMTVTNDGHTITIQITGNGNGDTVAGVAFLDPDPLARRVLGITRQWDVVAGDGSMRLFWDVPNEDAFQGGLLPFGLELRMQDSWEEKAFQGTDVLVSAPANAKSLSGSSSGSNYHSVFWPTMMNETITYSLTRGPVDQTPRVTIRGPECGCLDADNPGSTPLRFIATASRSGGEFSEFTVSASGKMPEIVDNQGGASASLELVGSKETGEATLTVEYVRNGRRFSAPPFKVQFCTIEKVELADNQRDLAFDLGGELTVNAKSKAWLNGQEATSDLEWQIEKIGTPTELKSDPDPARGEAIKFTYTNLPEQNAEFGEKTLTAAINKGPCSCTKEETIRAFYIDMDDGHPGTEPVPNWFYYWRQTRAMQNVAPLRYDKVVSDPQDGSVILARYDLATGVIHMGDLIVHPMGCRGSVDPGTKAPTGRHAQGIDCFAETLRHEIQHRSDAIEWWGSPLGATTELNLLDDADFDNVPMSVESATPGCSSLSKRSCTDRPFADVTDAEIRAYYVGWRWPLNSVNREDWSCGDTSKQWRGRNCP